MKGKVLSHLFLKVILTSCLMVFCFSEIPCMALINEAKVVLTYTYWGSVDADSARKKAINKFNQLHDGEIEAKCIYIPGDYDAKLYTMIASGNTPDVGIVDTSTSWAKLSENGLLADLSVFTNDDENFSTDMLIPGMEFYWDGQITAIGNEPQVFLMFYNKELFDKYKLDTPSSNPNEPWTWNKTIEVAKLMTIDANGHNATDPLFDHDNIVQYGLQVQTWFAALQTIIASNGGDYLTKDGMHCGLLENDAVEALQMISDLINVYHVMPSPSTSSSLGTTSNSMINGKVAMLIDGQWVANILGSAGFNFDVASVPSFGVKPVCTWIGTSGLSIFSGSQHPEESWELMKFLLTEGGNEQVVLDGVCLPVLKEWYTNEAIYYRWSTFEPYHPKGYNELIRDYAMKYSQPSVTLRIRNFERLDAVYSAALDDAWAGNKSVKDSLLEDESSINREIQGWIS